MTKIVIEVPNAQDALLLIEFAKRLNGVVQLTDEQVQRPQTAFAWLEALSHSMPFEAIEDVVEWQSQQRQDRILVR